MRVIDLLNRIANGEKLPEKIKVMGGTYYLCEGDLSGCYYFSEKQGFGGVKLSFDTSVMNEEVEISESVEEIYKRHIDYIYGEEDKKDKEIELYFNGKKVDITDIYEPLKQGEYFYKENGKWYAHRLKNVTFEVEEDKKDKEIERLNNIIKEVREYINKIPTQPVIRVFKKELLEILDKANKEE